MLCCESAPCPSAVTDMCPHARACPETLKQIGDWVGSSRKTLTAKKRTCVLPFCPPQSATMKQGQGRLLNYSCKVCRNWCYGFPKALEFVSLRRPFTDHKYSCTGHGPWTAVVGEDTAQGGETKHVTDVRDLLFEFARLKFEAVKTADAFSFVLAAWPAWLGRTAGCLG